MRNDGLVLRKQPAYCSRIEKFMATQEWEGHILVYGIGIGFISYMNLR